MYFVYESKSLQMHRDDKQTLQGAHSLRCFRWPEHLVVMFKHVHGMQMVRAASSGDGVRPDQPCWL